MRPGQRRPRPRHAAPLRSPSPRPADTQVAAAAAVTTQRAGDRRARAGAMAGRRRAPRARPGGRAWRAPASPAPRPAHTRLSRTRAPAPAAAPGGAAPARSQSGPGRAGRRARTAATGRQHVHTPDPAGPRLGALAPTPLVDRTAHRRLRDLGAPGDVPEDARGTHRQLSHSCPCSTSQGTARACF